MNTAINKERVGKLIKQTGMNYRDVSRILGKDGNYISNALYSGNMAKEQLKQLALFLRVTPDVLQAPAIEQKDKPATGGVELADVLKKQSETLEAILLGVSELLKAVTEMGRMESVMNEETRNHYVAENQLLNKIHNQMRYGTK